MNQRMISIGNTLILIAAVWAAGVSLYVFFSPVTIESQTAINEAGGAPVVETVSSMTSWYRVQGLWGSLVLLFFAGLYVLGVVLARRAKYRALAILGVFSLAISYLAGLSIGLLYLPAALALLAGLLVILFAGRVQP